LVLLGAEMVYGVAVKPSMEALFRAELKAKTNTAG
jgi:hypothetical protein